MNNSPEVVEEVVEEPKGDFSDRGIDDQNFEDFEFGGEKPPVEGEPASSAIPDGGEPSAQPEAGAEEEPTEGSEGLAPNDDSSPTGEPEQGTEEPELVTQQIESTLQELSGGSINNTEQLTAALEELDTLRKDATTPKEPEFQSDAQKRLWEFVQKHGDGKDPQVAMTYLSLMQIDTEKLDDREVLFQKFKIENPEIVGDRAKAIWEEMNEEYSVEALEESELKRYEFEQKVKKARNDISELQKEHLEGQPKEEENAQSEQDRVMEGIRNDIRAQVKSYKGVSAAFQKDPKDGTFKLVDVDPSKPVGNFDMKLSPEDLKDFQEAAENPDKLWSRIFNDKGELDHATYFDLLHYSRDPAGLKANLYGFAFNQGKIAAEKIAKNIPDEILPGGGKGAAVEPEDELLEDIRRGKLNQV
jgi:hypothetical protein